MRLVDVAHRGPRGFAVRAVYSAYCLAHCTAHIGVLGNASAAARSNLKVSHLATPIGKIGKEALERAHAFRNALAVVQAIDADRSEERRVGKACRFRWGEYH